MVIANINHNFCESRWRLSWARNNVNYFFLYTKVLYRVIFGIFGSDLTRHVLRFVPRGKKNLAEKSNENAAMIRNSSRSLTKLHQLLFFSCRSLFSSHEILFSNPRRYRGWENRDDDDSGMKNVWRKTQHLVSNFSHWVLSDSKYKLRNIHSSSFIRVWNLVVCWCIGGRSLAFLK